MHVVLNLKGLTTFASLMERNSPAILKTLKQWGARYRGFVKKRFDVYSKGGGDWPPLAPSTVKRRRKGKGKGTIAILRDTGTMYRALSPVLGEPGQIERVAGFFEVETGFGGPAAHPTGGRATISDIAAFHNYGMGHNPKRTIIVPPDAATREKMVADAERNLQAELDETSK